MLDFLLDSLTGLASPWALAFCMLAGDRWHARLDQARFERIVAALLVGSGAALLLK